MEHTSNYELSKWAESDRIMMEDFNMDHDKIDAALANGGNCKIAMGSYVGTGKYGADNPNTLTFDFKPQIVFLDTGTSTWTTSGARCVPLHFILYRHSNKLPTSGFTGDNTVIWGDTSVSWYFPGSASDSPAAQHNSARTYYYIAIGY